MDHHEAYFIEVGETLAPRGYNVHNTHDTKRHHNRSTTRREREARAADSPSAPGRDDRPPPPHPPYPLMSKRMLIRVEPPSWGDPRGDSLTLLCLCQTLRMPAVLTHT